MWRKSGADTVHHIKKKSKERESGGTRAITGHRRLTTLTCLRRGSLGQTMTASSPNGGEGWGYCRIPTPPVRFFTIELKCYRTVKKIRVKGLGSLLWKRGGNSLKLNSSLSFMSVFFFLFVLFCLLIKSVINFWGTSLKIRQALRSEVGQ